MKCSISLVFGVFLAPAAFGAVNLVPNGDFDAPAGDCPSGWERVEGAAEELIYASDAPQSGTHFLKLDTRRVEEAKRLAWHLKEPIPLRPGAKYRVEFHFRIDHSNMTGGQTLYLRGAYLDAEKRLLPWREVGQMGLNSGGQARVTSGWRFQQKIHTAPADAAFLDVRIGPARGFQGVVAADGVRVVEVPVTRLTLPSGGMAFDFTPIDVEPVPGFTGVPADLKHTEEKGHGWELRRRPVVNRTHDDNAYPTRLDATGVSGATFLCDLSDGRYLASIYMGALWRTSIGEMNHVVVIDGEDVIGHERSHEQLMDEEYFRYARATLVTGDDLARPGQAVWDRYIARRYRRHDFQFEVRGGRLGLEIKRGYANGLVIFPASREAEYRETIERFERDRRSEFVGTWAEFLPEPVEKTDFRPGDTDTARGYVVFARHWMRRVQYAARPQPDEVNPTLRLFATPGEYEPVTLSIWPLADLDAVRIEAEPLESEEGDVLPASIFRVWYHQHRQERRSMPCTAYRISTAYLPDWDTRDLYKDVTTRCWLNVKPPEDAKPGLYRGAVRVAPERGRATTIPIELRVMNFKLVRMEALHTFRRAGGAVIVPYPSGYPFAPGNKRNKQFYRAQAMRDLYEHGFQPEYTAWWHGIWKREGDRLTVDWDQDNSMSGRPGEYLQMIKDLAPSENKSLWVDACAIGHSYIMPAFEGNPNGGITVAHVEQWLDEIERQIPPLGFERVYLAPWGEESHFPPGKGFEEFLAFHRHVRANRDRWPHIFTAHTCNSEWGQPDVIREADLTALGMFHGVFGSAKEQVEAARRMERPFGLYGIRGRWVAGFYFWRSGASVTYHEFYAPYFGTPNNDWDNSTGMDGSANKVLNEAPGWCNATYSPDGRMIGTWFWEEMREGVDDHDYLNTLSVLVERSAGREGAAVKEARRQAGDVLSEITEAIRLDVDRSRMQGLVYRPVSEEEHDAMRWKAAVAAERLNAAMGAER